MSIKSGHVTIFQFLGKFENTKTFYNSNLRLNFVCTKHYHWVVSKIQAFFRWKTEFRLLSDEHESDWITKERTKRMFSSEMKLTLFSLYYILFHKAQQINFFLDISITSGLWLIITKATHIRNLKLKCPYFLAEWVMTTLSFRIQLLFS